MATWDLPTATAHPSGIRIIVPLRLHPEASPPASLWFATNGANLLLHSAWAYEQEHGGTTEICRWDGGVVVRAGSIGTSSFQPVGEFQAFATVPTCTGLYLPVGMVLRPAIRPVAWRHIRVPKAVHLFDGTKWLVLAQQGFRKIAELMEVMTPEVASAGQPWFQQKQFDEEIGCHGASQNLSSPVVRVLPTKAKPGFAKQLQQLFTSKRKAKETKPAEAEVPVRLQRVGTSIPNHVVQQLLNRDLLTYEQEIELWQTIAGADEYQAALARGHIEWLKEELTPNASGMQGQGLRAEWLQALVKSRQREGDPLYLATVYDRLQQQMDDGLDRVHDLPEFLWPMAGDPVRRLLELQEIFVESGPARGMVSAFAGILFASAALRCHEARLAMTWLNDASNQLKELRRTATQQAIARLLDLVRGEVRVRLAAASLPLEDLGCPKVWMLARHCFSIRPYLARLPDADPEWLLLGKMSYSATTEKLLNEAEQERTAAVLPGNVLRLSATTACRNSDEVARLVALVPDAIELQAEFWRTRWPEESQLFDVQVRWCERLLTWALEDLHRFRLDPTSLLRRLFAQAKERDTPVRQALARQEWLVQRSFKFTDSSLQKEWLGLGLLSAPSSLFLRGKLRESSKAFDDLTYRQAENPLHLDVGPILSASVLMPDQQAMERSISLSRLIAERLAEQGEDVFAWKNLVVLDGVLAGLTATVQLPSVELQAWIADDEQRLRKRMARDLARAIAAVN